MDFAQVIKELWDRRGWLAVGAAVALFIALSTAYRVSLFPPGLEPKTLALGTANTQVLVDSRNTALTDLDANLRPLTDRAAVFTKFMTSRPVRQAIAKEVGIPESRLLAEAPLLGNFAKATKEPSGAKRKTDLLGEQKQYRLRFEVDQGLPTIRIHAEAPRAADAVKLANAAAVGFEKYVVQLQNRQRVPEERRVAIRQLGEADGGTVGNGINAPLAALAFVGVLIIWTLLVLFAGALGRTIQTLREQEQGETDSSAA